MSDTFVSSFNDSVAPLLASYESLEVRAVCAINAKRLISCVACLTPNAPHETEVDDPLPGLRFIRQALSMRDFPLFLNGLEDGHVLLGHSEWAADGFRWFEPSTTTDVDFEKGWPDLSAYRCLTLRAWGEREPEEALRECRPDQGVGAFGFYTFSEMTQARLGFQVGNTYVTRLEVFAPILATIASTATDQAVTVRVKVSPGLPPETMTLTHRFQDVRGNRIDGGQIPLNDLEPTQYGEFMVRETLLFLPKGVASGELTLFHEGLGNLGPIAVNRFVSPPAEASPNVRWKAVDSLIGGTGKWAKDGPSAEQVVRNWLGLGNRAPQDDQAFERGVSVLLFSAGLEILQIGDADGVDHLVRSQTGEMVLVSCTITANLRERNKIGAVKIQRNRLAEAGIDDVRCALIVPRSRVDMLVGDVRECAENDVALLLRPDLESLADTAFGPTWTEAAALFMTLVKTASSSSMHGSL